MKFLNLTQHAGLIFLIIMININIDFVVHGWEPLDVSLNNVLPHHYNIALSLQTPGYRANATVDIKLDIHHVTREIQLHAASNILILWCDITPYSSGHIQSTRQITKDTASEIHTLHFLQNIFPGTHALYMSYIVLLNEVNEEAYTSYRCSLEHPDRCSQIRKKSFLVFNGGVNSTRRIFPCWDDPLFKSTFSISVTHSTNYSVFLSTRIISTKKWNDDSATRVTTFEKTPVIPTYLLGILITDTFLLTKAVERITLWHDFRTTDVAFALEVSNDTLQSLMWYLNYNYFSKLDVIILPGDFHVIQKWGLIVYSEGDIKYNAQFNSFDRKVNVAATAARGMIDQLSGNVISPSFSSHSWLNEGIASFFQLNAFAKVFETFPMEIFIIKFADDNHTDQFLQSILYGNHTRNITSSSARRYNRVPFILRMLQHLLGEQLFQDSINSYLKQLLSEPEDLWTFFRYTLQVGINEYSSASNLQVEDAIDACLLPKNDFILIVTKNTTAGYVYIYLQNLQVANGINDNWIVPVTYTLMLESKFEISLPISYINIMGTIFFRIDKNTSNWIIANVQRIGCYRVQYDSTNWKSIAHYLNNDNYSKIHVLNRAQIIDDAYYFMVKRKIAFSLFLNIISYLKRETEYAVWYAMEPVVKYIWDICKNSRFNKIKDIMSEIWDGLLADVGYDDKMSGTFVTQMKRTFALKWACKFGHTDCRRLAAIQMKYFLIDLKSEIGPQLNTIEKWKLCMGMMTADTETLHLMISKNKYIGKDIIHYLACAEDEATIIFYLNFLIHSTEEFLTVNKTRTNAYNIIVKQHAERYNVLVHILSNFRTFKVISGSCTMDALANIINNTYSARNLYKIREYIYDSVLLFRNILNDVEDLIDSRLFQTTNDIEYFTL